MANNGTKIYVGDGTGIRLQQDIHVVLGATGGLGHVIANADINPLARYKPFRSSSPNYANATARATAMAAADYGMKFQDAISKGSADGMTAHYTAKNAYVRPNTYFRMLDFDGYVHPDTQNGYSLAPMFPTFDQNLKTTTTCVFFVMFDSTSHGWNATDYLRMAELYKNHLNHRLCLLFINTTSGHFGGSFVVYGKTLTDILNNDNKQALFLVSGDENVYQGYYAPKLSDHNYEGDTYVVRWAFGNANYTGYRPDFSDGDFYPLEPTTGIDRQTYTLTPSVVIEGLSGSLGTTAYTTASAASQTNRCTFSAFNVIVNSLYAYTNFVYLKIKITNRMGLIYRNGTSTGSGYLELKTLVSPVAIGNNTFDLTSLLSSYAFEYYTTAGYGKINITVDACNNTETQNVPLFSSEYYFNRSGVTSSIRTNPSGARINKGASASFTILALKNGTETTLAPGACTITAGSLVSTSTSGSNVVVTAGNTAGDTSVAVAYTNEVGEVISAIHKVTVGAAKTISRIMFGTSTGTETSQYNAVSGNPCRIYVYIVYSDSSISEDISAECALSKTSGPSGISFSHIGSATYVTGTNSTSLIQFNDIRATYNGFTADVSVRVSPA